MSKEYVHDYDHGERGDIHSQRRSDQETPPGLRVLAFNFLKTVFCPSVRKVDEENQPQEKEEHGTSQSYVIAPEHEEALGDEERQDHECQPYDNFGAPKAVLKCRTPILGGPNS